MDTTSTDPFSAQELAAWRGMLQVHARITRALDVQMRAEHGISVSAYEVLLFLDEAPDHRLRMAEIADRVLLSRSGCTRLIDRLAKLGYVTRSAAETDGRGSFAALTDAGLETFRAALAWFLKNEGYSVLEGKGWDSAAESLCQECVSAVVLDISMESDDSLALCERLRNVTKIPFIVLSSNASKKAMANALRSGARCVLLKPLKESVLAERLAELLALPSGTSA